MSGIGRLRRREADRLNRAAVRHVNSKCFLRNNLIQAFTALRVVACAPSADDFLQRLAGAERGTIGAMGTHGLDDVGDRQDARLEDDLLASQLVRIAGAVQPFVVLERGLGDRPDKVNLLEDVRSELRVCFDDAELVVADLGRLGEDFGGHGDLADVVDIAGDAQALDPARGIPISAAMSQASCATRRWWPAVYGSRISSVEAIARMLPSIICFSFAAESLSCCCVCSRSVTSNMKWT